MEYLREEFKFYLKLAKPLILNMPKPKDRILSAAWLKKILDENAGSEDLRTVYLKLLLFTLQRRKLAGLFNDNPTKYDKFEKLPSNLNLNELAKNILKQEQDERQRKITEELLGHMEVYPAYMTDCSSDLKEYVVAQDIPKFGVHAYYALSDEPIDKWLRCEKAILPKGAHSIINRKTITDSTRSTPSCVCTPGHKNNIQTDDSKKIKDDNEKPECQRKPESPTGRRKRKSSRLGNSPPIQPIGDVQQSIEEREVPTWGTNLLELKEKVDFGKISKQSEMEKELEKEALQFLGKDCHAVKSDTHIGNLTNQIEDMLQMINEYKAGKFDKLRKPCGQQRKEVQFTESALKQEVSEDYQIRNITNEDEIVPQDFNLMDIDTMLQTTDRSAFNLGVDDDQMVVNLYNQQDEDFEDVFNISQTAGGISTSSAALSDGIPVVSSMPSPIPKRHPSPERFLVEDVDDEMIFNKSRSSPLSPLMLQEVNLPAEPEGAHALSYKVPSLTNIHEMAQSVIEDEQRTASEGGQFSGSSTPSSKQAFPGLTMAPQDPRNNANLSGDSCPTCGSSFDVPFLDEVTPPFGIFEGDLDASPESSFGEGIGLIEDISPPPEFYEVEPTPQRPSPQQILSSGAPPCAQPGPSRLRPPSQLRPPGQVRFPSQIRSPSQIRAPRQIRPPSQLRAPRQIRPPSQMRGPSLIRTPARGIPARPTTTPAQTVCDPCDTGGRSQGRPRSPAAPSRLPMRPGRQTGLPRPGTRPVRRPAPPPAQQRVPLYFPPSREEAHWGSPPTARELRAHQIPGDFYEPRGPCQLYIPERQTHITVPRRSRTRVNLMQRIAEGGEEGPCAPCGATSMLEQNYPEGEFERLERAFQSPPRPTRAPQSPESPDILGDFSQSMAKTLMEQSKRDVRLKATHQEIQLQGSPRRNVQFPAEGITYSPKRPQEQFGPHPWAAFEQRYARLQREAQQRPPPRPESPRSPDAVPDLYDLPLDEMYENIHDISAPVFPEMSAEDRLPEGIYSPPLVVHDVRRDIRAAATPRFDPRRRRDLRREDRRAMRPPPSTMYNIPEGSPRHEAGLYTETPKRRRSPCGSPRTPGLIADQSAPADLYYTPPPRSPSPGVSYIADQPAPADLYYTPPPRSPSPVGSSAGYLADQSAPEDLYYTPPPGSPSPRLIADESIPSGFLEVSGCRMLDDESFPQLSGASLIESEENGCHC